MRAAAASGHNVCLQLLVGARASVNYSSAAPSALHLSCGAGHEGCARTLLGAHAAVNKGSDSATPLAAACAAGHEACARLLIGCSAAVDFASMYCSYVRWQSLRQEMVLLLTVSWEEASETRITSMHTRTAHCCMIDDKLS